MYKSTTRSSVRTHSNRMILFLFLLILNITLTVSAPWPREDVWDPCKYDPTLDRLPDGRFRECSDEVWIRWQTPYEKQTFLEVQAYYELLRSFFLLNADSCP
ncbi:5923_t:CDS:2 [Paraglomus occultum]|uniref:5923_t:CDS:1 n=1 Tax=Paraglomus occultum TaxID=144539 RepID=A0A9N9A690_9GLOM|nr:5923_t:CDS:2 [Paraglomus occultum]